MSLNESGVYYFSEQFEEQMKKCLAKYLHSNSNRLLDEEYERICYLLCQVESKFYEEYPRGTDDLRTFARTRIVRKLAELDGNDQHDDDGSDSEGWTKIKSKIESVAKKIWKIWCDERERCPRAGITPVYIDPSGSIEILLTRYMKNGEIQLGLPKGKMEDGEYVITCAVREGNEEVGVDPDWLRTQLQGVTPIKKNIFNQNIKEVVEHYYYIVQVPTKDIVLQPNGTEIEGCDWHDIFTVECSKCSEKNPISVKCDPRKTNYFMVNCTDHYDRTSLIVNVLKYVDEIKRNDFASKKYKRLHEHSMHP